MSKFIKHTTCPKCGSEDNLGVYDDHVHCFGFDCNYYKKLDGKDSMDFDEHSDDDEVKAKSVTSKPIRGLPLAEMPGQKQRGLLSSTINKYKVSVSQREDSPLEAVFPLFDENGSHVANQLRYKDKQFASEGNLKAARLFGQHLFPAGGRSITVTEGYYDALSAFQMTGSRYPNVAVQSASSAKKEFVANFEYLNSFDKVVINFDSDEPGQKAAKQVASLFEPGKVAILKLEKFKDASDYLVNGDGKKYIDEWFKAPVFMPDGLQLGSDPNLLDEIIKYKQPKSVPYPWEGLNEKTYGIRPSEFVLLLADTGVGKTSVFKAIEYALLMDPELQKENAGIGFLHLEEPKRDLALGLMSIHNSKPYHFPDVERTEEELREAYKAVLATDRVVIWDHFGSNDIDIVLAKVRHMAALGCKYVFLDHLSIIVSDQSGDERKQLDEISTKLKTLTMNLDIAVLAVIHTNRQGEVRSSAGPEKVANIMIRLERDKKDLNEWRRNVTKISVEKNRPFGRTGPACYLYYNEITGRLEELSKDLAQMYEQGGSSAGNEFEMYKAKM